MSLNIYLVFIIDFQSCVQGSFGTVTSLCMGFHKEKAVAGLVPCGLKTAKSHDTQAHDNYHHTKFCCIRFTGSSDYAGKYQLKL